MSTATSNPNQTLTSTSSASKAPTADAGTMRHIVVHVAPLLLLLAGRTLQAGTIFLGPLPYRSAADSPFDLSGLGTTFFLEDFEDGELNSPGITQPLPPSPQSIVLLPGPETDSVDADDGLIDGLGRDGHSLGPQTIGAFPTEPPRYFQRISLFLSDNPPELVTNAFGFVWTGGGPDTQLVIHVYDSEIRKIGEQSFFNLGSGIQEGETDADKFIGVIADRSIGAIGIESSHRDEFHMLEIDHVQYGAYVSEPGTMVLAVGLSPFCALCFFRARHFVAISK